MQYQIEKPAVIDLIVPRREAELDRVIFPSESPDFAFLIYRDAPPVLKDLRRARTFDALNAPGIFGSEIVLDETVDVPVRFASPAVDAAFAVGENGRSRELAIAFGAGDYHVHRCALPSGRFRPPVSVEDPVRVRYNPSGTSLAVGSESGSVGIFDVVETPILANSLMTSGRVMGCDLSYRDYLFAFTETTPIFGFGRKTLNAKSYHPKSFDGEPVEPGSWRYLACDPRSSLLYLSSKDGQFWLLSPESFVGGLGLNDVGERVLGAQFVGDNQLLVTGEKGFELWFYGREDDGSMGVCRCIMDGRIDSSEDDFCGAAKYGDVLFIVSVR